MILCKKPLSEATPVGDCAGKRRKFGDWSRLLQKNHGLVVCRPHILPRRRGKSSSWTRRRLNRSRNTAISGENWTMIATTVVDEIHRLLGEGHLSQRGIALRIGVSRGTVNAIARGKRICDPARRPRDEEGFTPPRGLPVRCPGCGGRVQMPCLLCYMRLRRGRQNPKGSSPLGSRARGTTATASFG